MDYYYLIGILSDDGLNRLEENASPYTAAYSRGRRSVIREQIAQLVEERNVILEEGGGADAAVHSGSCGTGIHNRNFSRKHVDGNCDLGCSQIFEDEGEGNKGTPRKSDSP